VRIVDIFDRLMLSPAAPEPRRVDAACVPMGRWQEGLGAHFRHAIRVPHSV